MQSSVSFCLEQIFAALSQEGIREMETKRVLKRTFQERLLIMTRNTKLTTFGLLAVFAGASALPAMADSWGGGNLQNNKNNARNLALGGAAVAAYGLLTHNSTATLLGAAGAALAGSQYERDSQIQSRDNGRFYDYHNYGNGGYDRDGYNRDGFNHDGYNRSGFNHNGYNRDGFNHRWLQPERV